ncbi:MAG TPA: DUF99 family protein [Candidatus Woesearchaeota archaeon]|nr:DUF99 family protein [Candidatus Woesearchaeota archaeon]
MKKELRVIGIDDAPFDKFDPLQKYVLVVGTVYRGGSFMDGLLSCYVEKDGDDATMKIIDMINESKFKPQLQAVFLDGIAVAGFNIINPRAVYNETGIPVVVIIREYPDYKKLFAALEKAGMKKKIRIIKRMPKPVKISNVYVQNIGISLEETEELLRITCSRANVPEAIRVSHLIASGIVDGQSRGRA